MKESFTFRGKQNFGREEKTQKKMQKEKMSMHSLYYTVQKFDIERIEKMNRLQLFEILYQVEQANNSLKKQTGFEMTTILNLQQIFESLKNKSALTPEKEQTKYSEAETQYKQLMRLMKVHEEDKKQQQAEKLYLETVLNLQSQICQQQKELESIQPQELEAYLSKLEAAIKQTEQRLARQQVMQKYSKNKSPTEDENSKQNSSDSDPQIDLIMEELYDKVKHVMIINRPEDQ